MNNTIAKTKYNKDNVKKLIEDKRGGLLVEQLYEAIPENERPARSYFVEFLRSIKGVYVHPFDVFSNRFFATTWKEKLVAKRRLLVMLAAWEYENKKPAKWYIEPHSLHHVYRELIARLPDRDGNSYNNGGAINLEESFIWMAWFGGKQKAALKNRHQPKDEFILELEDGTIIDFSDTEKIKVEESKRVYVGKESKWGNPFAPKKRWFEIECETLYPAHFWANNLYDDLDELFNKELYVHPGEDDYHLKFLKNMVEFKEGYTGDEGKVGPEIPPIHLYNLLRRRIYLEIVQDDDHRVGKLVFHVFDIDDDLMFKYVSEYIKTIFEFMTYHRLARHFSINFYTWCDEKKDLYKERFIITLKSILRQRMFTFKSNLDDKFKKDMEDVYKDFFDGYNFKSLNIDRFLYEKGKHYWTKHENLTLFNNSGEGWRELVQKDPNKLRIKAINDAVNNKSVDDEKEPELIIPVENEQEPENIFTEDNGYFNLG